MTSDPKAPGAAAVYLYREETWDDYLHYHTYYERIKVLTEKGKDLAKVRIPYERGESKVVHIEGRTIHPDGTVVPLTVKPADLVAFKTKHFQVDTIIFTLPSVEVGSILEYRLQINYEEEVAVSPTWNIQEPYFVHKEHFMFHPNAGGLDYVRDNRGRTLNVLMWATVGPPDRLKVVKDRSRYTVDLTDVPALPDDDWMPPMNAINWRVSFYYTYAQDQASYWRAEGNWLASVVNAYVQPTDKLKKAAAEIVAPSDTDEMKARKLYAAVMKLNNTNFSRVKSEAERKKEKLKQIGTLDDVWTQQTGTGSEIAFLYTALARAAGLKAWPARVVNRDDAIFDPTNLSTDQLDDYVVRLVIGGKDIWVDPAEKMCPFGELYWTHALAGGLRLTENGGEIGYTPGTTYQENADLRTADLTLDTEGNVKGIARIILSGSEAIYWRQLALKEGDDAAKKEFTETLRDDFPDGVEADLDHFLGFDDPERNLMAVVNVSGPMGTVTGKRFLLPGLFFRTRAKHPFVAQQKRDTPIDVRYAKMEQDDVTYHLPANYAVESSPHTSDVTWPGSAALRIKSAINMDGNLEVTRLFAHGFTLLRPESYNDLHDFYLKLAAADQQQIVLTRAAAAKGN